MEGSSSLLITSRSVQQILLSHQHTKIENKAIQTMNSFLLYFIQQWTKEIRESVAVEKNPSSISSSPELPLHTQKRYPVSDDIESSLQNLVSQPFARQLFKALPQTHIYKIKRHFRHRRKSSAGEFTPHELASNQLLHSSSFQFSQCIINSEKLQGLNLDSPNPETKPVYPSVEINIAEVKRRFYDVMGSIFASPCPSTSLSSDDDENENEDDSLEMDTMTHHAVTCILHILEALAGYLLTEVCLQVPPSCSSGITDTFLKHTLRENPNIGKMFDLMLQGESERIKDISGLDNCHLETDQGEKKKSLYEFDREIIKQNTIRMSLSRNQEFESVQPFQRGHTTRNSFDGAAFQDEFMEDLVTGHSRCASTPGNKLNDLNSANLNKSLGTSKFPRSINAEVTNDLVDFDKRIQTGETVRMSLTPLLLKEFEKKPKFQSMLITPLKSIFHKKYTNSLVGHFETEQAMINSSSNEKKVTIMEIPPEENVTFKSASKPLLLKRTGTLKRSKGRGKTLSKQPSPALGKIVESHSKEVVTTLPKSNSYPSPSSSPVIHNTEENYVSPPLTPPLTLSPDIQSPPSYESTMNPSSLSEQPKDHSIPVISMPPPTSVRSNSLLPAASIRSNQLTFRVKRKFPQQVTTPPQVVMQSCSSKVKPEISLSGHAEILPVPVTKSCVRKWTSCIPIPKFRQKDVTAKTTKPSDNVSSVLHRTCPLPPNFHSFKMSNTTVRPRTFSRFHAVHPCWEVTINSNLSFVTYRSIYQVRIFQVPLSMLTTMIYKQVSLSPYGHFCPTVILSTKIMIRNGEFFQVWDLVYSKKLVENSSKLAILEAVLLGF